MTVGGKEMREEKQKQRWHSLCTSFLECFILIPINEKQLQGNSVIACNGNINFSTCHTSEVWGFFCLGIALWQSTGELCFAGFTSLFISTSPGEECGKSFNKQS